MGREEVEWDGGARFLLWWRSLGPAVRGGGAMGGRQGIAGFLAALSSACPPWWRVVFRWFVAQGWKGLMVSREAGRGLAEQEDATQ